MINLEGLHRSRHRPQKTAFFQSWASPVRGSAAAKVIRLNRDVRIDADTRKTAPCKKEQQRDHKMASGRYWLNIIQSYFSKITPMGVEGPLEASTYKATPRSEL